MIQLPLPPGREFQAGYLPEFRHFATAPTATPPPAPQPPMMPDLSKTAAGGGGQPLILPPEKGSTGAETASFYGGAGAGGGGMGSSAPDPFHGVNPQWVAAEPGKMSVLGMSTGTGVDEMGYMHDALVADPGAGIGGALGMLGGPIGSAIGSMAGRQANWNEAVDDWGLMKTPQGANATAWDVIGSPDDYSHGEVYNAEEYMDSLKEAGTSLMSDPNRKAAIERALARVMATNPIFGRTGGGGARQMVGSGGRQVQAPASTPNRGGSTTERGHNAPSKENKGKSYGVSSSKSKK